MLADIIFYIHALFVLSCVLIPFLPPKWIIFKLYIVMIPFIVLHWLLNNDTCVLTILESYIRKVPMKNTFMSSLVGPIYAPPSRSIYIATGILYVIAVYRTIYNFRIM